MKDVERVARVMRELVINNGEGDTYQLFDLLGFSGENQAHIATYALAQAAMAETRRIDAKALRKGVTRLKRCLMPIVMSMAYEELTDGKTIPDDAVVLSFSGGGGGDFVTAGEIREAMKNTSDFPEAPDWKAIAAELAVALRACEAFLFPSSERETGFQGGIEQAETVTIAALEKWEAASLLRTAAE